MPAHVFDRVAIGSGLLVLVIASILLDIGIALNAIAALFGSVAIFRGAAFGQRGLSIAGLLAVFGMASDIKALCLVSLIAAAGMLYRSIVATADSEHSLLREIYWNVLCAEGKSIDDFSAFMARNRMTVEQGVDWSTAAVNRLLATADQTVREGLKDSLDPKSGNVKKSTAVMDGLRVLRAVSRELGGNKPVPSLQGSYSSWRRLKKEGDFRDSPDETRRRKLAVIGGPSAEK